MKFISDLNWWVRREERNICLGEETQRLGGIVVLPSPYQGGWQ